MIAKTWHHSWMDGAFKLKTHIEKVAIDWFLFGGGVFAVPTLLIFGELI